MGGGGYGVAVGLWGSGWGEAHSSLWVDLMAVQLLWVWGDLWGWEGSMGLEGLLWG